MAITNTQNQPLAYSNVLSVPVSNQISLSPPVITPRKSTIVFGEDLIIDWSANPNASTIVVEVSPEPGFVPILQTVVGNNRTEGVHIKNLSPGTYWIRASWQMIGK